MPVKLCECGCREPAPIAVQSNTKWGHVKGEPTRFVKGHRRRRPVPRRTKAEVAWLAGLLEGEGCFITTSRTRRPKNRPAWQQVDNRIQLAMNDEDVVARAAALMGTGYWRRDDKLFSTSISGGRGADLARILRPLMGARRRAAIDRMLAACDAGRVERKAS